MVNSRGIMLTQDAYDLLVEEQKEDESYSKAIIRLIEEVRAIRGTNKEEKVVDYIEDVVDDIEKPI